MASVLNRITRQFLRSANTPDFPVADWIINPDMSAVNGVPRKYWVITGDVVSGMDQAAKDAVDAAEGQAREDGELLQLDSGILRRFVLVLLDEINRARTADGAGSVTITQLKNQMRDK